MKGNDFFGNFETSIFCYNLTSSFMSLCLYEII